MKKYLLVLICGLYISGCAAAPFVVAGAAGAGTTYSVATDSVSDNIDAKVPQIVDVFINVIKDNDGNIMYASISEGKVRAEIKDNKYNLSTKELTVNSSRFTVTARKTYNLLPAREKALKIYNEMLERLK